MKAQFSKNKEAPGLVSKPTDERDSGWPLLLGLLMADVGLLLIAFAGWDALRARAQALFYSSGAVLCFAGLVLIWIGTIKLADRRDLPAASAA
jgi:threonine/homoserine/homoserine lactone efflux protein